MHDNGNHDYFRKCGGGYCFARNGVIDHVAGDNAGSLRYTIVDEEKEEPQYMRSDTGWVCGTSGEMQIVVTTG